MRTQKITPWDDVLFENRNKDYGAYQLRMNENFNLLKSLAVLILMIGFLILAYSFTHSSVVHTDSTDSTDSVNVYVRKIVDPILPKVKPTNFTPIKIKKTAALPNPTDHPTVQKTIENHQTIGNSNPDDNNPSFKPSIIPTQNNLSNLVDSGNLVKKPVLVNTPEKIWSARDVSEMAIYPGCEKFVGNNKKLQDCMASNLNKELGIQLSEFNDKARNENIDVAVAKLKFVVDVNGRIVQIKALNGGNESLSQEAQKAMEQISERLKQKNKIIKPAKLSDGTPANLIFTIPVKFEMK